MYLELLRELTAATLVDATGLVNWIRTIKSPEEIRYMRDAGRIACNAYHRVLNDLRAGIRQNDALSGAIGAMMTGIGGCAGSWPCFPVFIAAGPNPTIHKPISDELLEPGSVVTVELGASRLRYHAALNRTFVLGRPTDPLRSLAAASIDAFNHTFDRIAPGRATKEIAEVWQQSMARGGIHKKARLGYSIGIGFPPTWGENTYNITPEDSSILRPGMTFHFNLGMWGEGINFAVSETALVTETGVESLTPFERALFVNE